MTSKAMFSSNSSDWETPPEIFEPLDEVFQFTLDPCATKKSAKCRTFYTIKEDGLKQSWKDESTFVNPPYGNAIDKWVLKSYVTLTESKGSLVVMLIAARTETKRWQTMILPNARAICFLKKRVKFWLYGKPFQVLNVLTGKIRGGSPAFPSAIIVFGSKKLTKKERVVLWSLGYLWER